MALTNMMTSGMEDYMTTAMYGPAFSGQWQCLLERNLTSVHWAPINVLQAL